MWALPFLTVLCPSERYYIERGRTHRSLTERARQLLRVVDRWLPHREKVVVADSRFAALALLAALPDKLGVVTLVAVGRGTLRTGFRAPGGIPGPPA